MLYVVAALAVFIGIRLYALKQEVRNVRAQLQRYNEQRTDKKIDVALMDRNLEQLAAAVNDLIDQHVREKRERARSEDELKQTIANMSHDLRTPMTSILGYLQLAESDDASDEERRAYLDTARQRAHRLEALLRDFFELSVIESAEYRLKPEPMNMATVTIEVLMSFYDRFRDKKMEPAIDVPEQDVSVTTDPAAVTRVMENLIANAITHADGPIRIALEDRGSLVRFRVTNGASALTEQDVDRLFDRFYRADQSRTGNNTGLGLSIVKSLMAKMDGTVTGELADGQLSIVCEWKRAT